MRRDELPLVLPATLLALLLSGCSEADPAPSALPSAASPSSPSPPSVPSPTEPPPPSAESSPPGAGAKGGVVLGGQDLGVTRLGMPMDEAVRAVSAVLGEPDEDPAEAVRCIASSREVRWDKVVLAADGDLLAGWSSRSTTVQTPSGVAVGTPVSTLEQLYGETLERIPANPDNPLTFRVKGVDVRGSLSTAGRDAVVTSLFSSFCSGP